MHTKRRRGINSNQVILQVIALTGTAWYVLFFYFPYIGLSIAFRDFKLTDNLFDMRNTTWIGFQFFGEMIRDREMPRVIANTVIISLMKLAVCLPSAILFALLLNEVPKLWYKKLVQTISYFPHFISWIIISLIALYFLSPQFGMINILLTNLGLISRPLTVLTNSKDFYWLATLLELWKELGWSSILFIAAVSGIDPTLYEAAIVDGASRWHKMFYITLPSIMGVVVLVFILQFSGIFSGGGGTFEQSIFLGNTLNMDKSMVLGHYTMKTGISLGRFSYATAVGLVNGIVGLILLGAANSFCKKFLGRGLYTGGDGQ